MRKYSENLFEKMMNGVEKAKNGNHSMAKIGESWYFMYHKNIILTIDVEEKRIIVDNCGFNTVSTTQAINSHLDGIRQYVFYNEFKFVDLSQNKKFAVKIKQLFGKDIDNK